MKQDRLICSFSSTAQFREALEQLFKAVPADCKYEDISMAFIPPGVPNKHDSLGLVGYVGVNWTKS